MSNAQIGATHLMQIYSDVIEELSSVNGMPRLQVRKDAMPQVAHYLHSNQTLQGSLSLLWAVDHRPRETCYEICYLFTLNEQKDWLLLSTYLEGDDRLFHSITPYVHAAQWYEREIRDMFGLIPVGHPDMRRLVRHDHWPKGSHPLKKEFQWDTVVERVQGQHKFRHIEGEGVYQIPVGPIHAGIIEPGHFRFSVAGEPIMQLEIFHFWKHRGVEKLFERQQLTEAIPLAERISGDTAVGHSLTYCQAIETLMQVEVPPRAQYLRSCFLELERLHNHLGDIGAICNDTAFVLPHSHCGRMKEQVMQLNDRLTGSRFLRGVNSVGGVNINLSHDQLHQIVEELDVIERDFTELEQILFVDASLIDRLETTGIIDYRVAWDYGVVGVVGRASGIDRDCRRDRPFAAYNNLEPKVALYKYGDVRARMRVRIDEIHESMRLIRDISKQIPSGPIAVEPSRIPTAGEWTLAAVEGWRGEILYAVTAGENGSIHRCKVRDPSFVNWPAIELAVLGNIVPDFPLINKSFNLSYAGNDL